MDKETKIPAKKFSEKHKTLSISLDLAAMAVIVLGILFAAIAANDYTRVWVILGLVMFSIAFFAIAQVKR